LLEADLAKGAPLKAALAARALPEFYVQMIEVGVAGNDLPSVLLMLADHYQQASLIWTRLKGLMVYPLLLLFAGCLLSTFVSVTFLSLVRRVSPDVFHLKIQPWILINLWAPPFFIAGLGALVVAALATPQLRRELVWRLPAFREAKLAQAAGATAIVLRSGGNLGDALKLMQDLEAGTIAGRELAAWHGRLAGGRGKFSDLARPGKAFPPLFIWLVTNSGEELAGGFQRAAEIYGARAAHRMEMLLYAALPTTMLAMGTMVACQVLSMAGILFGIINAI
jgi:type II secretory pathway component PulF